MKKRDNKKTRRIYEKYYGKIPKEENGRSYHIHHVDGNSENNDPSNLVAVSLKEHYEIHLKQKDFGAAHILSKLLKTSHEEMSKLSTLQNLKRVENGTHPFLGGKIAKETQLRRVEEGVHQWCDSEWQRFYVKKRVENGTHNFLGGEIQRKSQEKLLKEGKHTSQIKKTCDYCKKIVDISNFGRWHGNNCKFNKEKISHGITD